MLKIVDFPASHVGLPESLLRHFSDILDEFSTEADKRAGEDKKNGTKV